jgi:precorrin-8X/cobalt-precorrin-8 methylmutase
MSLFDRYVAVDWSAYNSRKLGKDSIWSCVGDRAGDDVQTRNHPTRRGAESWLLHQFVSAVAAGERVLAGMDFPYGYPAGFAAALGQSGDPWRATWRYLTDHVVDDGDNRSNRFEVASDVNVALGLRAPFWGRPQHLSLPGLSARRNVVYRGVQQPDQLPEWREVEQTLRDRGASPQPAWKLAYTGSVGSRHCSGSRSSNGFAITRRCAT